MSAAVFRLRLPPLGQADLLRLSLAFPDVSSKVIGRLLGYEVLDRTGRRIGIEGRGEGSGIQIQAPDVSSQVDQKGEVPAVPFWHVVRRVLIGGESGGAVETGDVGDNFTALPNLKRGPALQHVPLRPWAQLWPAMRVALGKELSTRIPDEPHVIRRLGKGEVLEHIPCQSRRVWPRNLLLAEDNSLRLFPFWQDYVQIRTQLKSILPQDSMRVFRVASGPLRKGVFRDEPELTPLLQASRGKAVLILSDLGYYSDSSWLYEDWLAYGRRMHGCGVRPVVLTPVPRRCWHSHWDRFFHMISWGDSRNPMPAGSNEAILIERVLALASPAVRVEPRLLRALCRLLPGADSGVEARAWNHDAVDATYLAFSFRRDRLQYFRDAFLAESEDLRRQVLAIIAEQHAFLPAEVRLEEYLSTYALRYKLDETVGLSNAVGDYIDWLSTCLRDDTLGRIQPWMRRMAWRQVDWIKTVPGAEGIGRSVAKAFINDGDNGQDKQRPNWISEEDMAAAYGTNTLEQTWSIRQVGQTLRVTKADGSSSGCLLGELPGITLLQVREGKRVTSWEVGSELEYLLPDDERLYLFANDARSRVYLSTMLKPKWADAITRRANGLFAEWNGLDASWVLREELGKFCVRPYGGLESAYAIGQVEYGMWQFPNRSELNWAARIGEDQYGLYAEFDFQGITQRMRWIMPGTFTMGSPEDETDQDDETQHEVTLNHGFWLADTTCTQELWQAVMGENPSKFKGQEYLPVDSVSWDMCQEFCTRINKTVPDLHLRLPTEAQWEYACRAGTSTPFSFGEHITTAQANFNGQYPYMNGPKGVYREQTMPVRALPCNQWGLYQMHGNVWEWCADWYGKYSHGSVTDPPGPKKGVIRVLRGGGWFVNGGSVRSADRSVSTPDSWDFSVGFRFSRGHQG